MQLRYLLTIPLLSCIASANAAIEIWLARSPQCNTCALFEQVAEDRNYGDALKYKRDGTVLTIPIHWLEKRALGEDVLNQLAAEDGAGNPYWDIQLTVLVVDGGRVLSAGHIAESADMRALQPSDAAMFPPDAPEKGHPALDGDPDYTRFFLANWNLEHFVDVALGQRPPRDDIRLVDLSAENPVQVGSSNVIFWGSAATPLASSLFIPQRITEIRAAVESLELAGIRYTTLYGHGPGVPGNDTSYMAGGTIKFMRADIAADLPAGAASLNRVLTGMKHREDSRSLIVQVGHSGPTGSPLWGEVLALAPEDVAPLKQVYGADVIIVSGACHGGLFAQAVSCGFFAAHPNVTASGCQLSAEAIRRSDDYLRHFFRAATGAVSLGKDAGMAPATFYDAHWYASTRLEDHQISYTTTDALIDDYFAAHPERLPAATTIGGLKQWADRLTAAEVRGLETLTAGLPPDLAIPLTGFVELNHQAYAKLTEARELSSLERNRIIALPYKLVLPLLTRRMLYRSLEVESPAFNAARACEQQSIVDYLGVSAGG